MKVLAAFGFVLLSAVCVSGRFESLTKESVATCLSDSGFVKMAATLDGRKFKEQGPQVGFCMAGCLMRHAGYIDSTKKLNETSMVNDFVNILDAEVFNVKKIKEAEVGCIHKGNKEANECDVTRAYLLCSMQNSIAMGLRMAAKIHLN